MPRNAEHFDEWLSSKIYRHIHVKYLAFINLRM